MREKYVKFMLKHPFLAAYGSGVLMIPPILYLSMLYLFGEVNPIKQIKMIADAPRQNREFVEKCSRLEKEILNHYEFLDGEIGISFSEGARMAKELGYPYPISEGDRITFGFNPALLINSGPGLYLYVNGSAHHINEKLAEEILQKAQ